MKKEEHDELIETLKEIEFTLQSINSSILIVAAVLYEATQCSEEYSGVEVSGVAKARNALQQSMPPIL